MGLRLDLAPYLTAAPTGDAAFPEWLPEAPSGARPVVYADFKNAHYWADGEEQAGPNDLFFADAVNWGGYQASDVVAGLGMQNPGPGGSSGGLPLIKHELLGDMLNGVTAVLRVSIDYNDTDNTNAGVGIVQLPDFNSFSYVARIFVLPGSNVTNGSATVLGVSSEGTRIIAGTVVGEDVAGSLDGAAVVTGTNGISDPFTDIGLTSSFFGAFGANYVESVAFYENQPDADLPAMSAA